MGQRLMKYYQYISKEDTTACAKFELAVRTKIPAVFAEREPDSPVLIELFKTTVEQITGKPAPRF